VSEEEEEKQFVYVCARVSACVRGRSLACVCVCMRVFACIFASDCIGVNVHVCELVFTCMCQGTRTKACGNVYMYTPDAQIRLRVVVVARASNLTLSVAIIAGEGGRDRPAQTFAAAAAVAATPAIDSATVAATAAAWQRPMQPAQ